MWLQIIKVRLLLFTLFILRFLFISIRSKIVHLFNLTLGYRFFFYNSQIWHNFFKEGFLIDYIIKNIFINTLSYWFIWSFVILNISTLPQTYLTLHQFFLKFSNISFVYRLNLFLFLFLFTLIYFFLISLLILYL